jgi:SAM-dependent methyltransferase
MALPTCCCLCGAAAERQFVVVPRVYGDSDGRAVFRCESCDVRYLYPGLAPHEEEQLYANEFESFMRDRSANNAGWEGPQKHIAANESQRRRRMGHLETILKPKSRILEVGCGSGFMLYPLLEAGHECVAIEPSGIFSEYVRGRGVACYRSLEDMSDAGASRDGFDLILHYYVMEHLADPVKFLRTQLGLLQTAGSIVFEVPNANDALTVLYQIPAYEKFIWVVSHRWYFTEKSLATAITMAGGQGEVLLDQRYDLSNHIVWARDGRPGGMGRFTEFLGKDIEEHYRQTLIRARLCDTLIGVVRA